MKKPKIEQFTELMRKYGGNVTNVADALGVSRVSVHGWINNDARFKKAYEDQRGRTLDSLVKTAVSLAQGIPKIKDGKRVGWKEEPNWRVLTYLIGKLGIKEGWGEKVDITSNGESIKADPVVVEIIDSRAQVVKPDDESEE